MLNVIQKPNKKETVIEIEDIDNVPELESKLTAEYVGQTFRYTGVTIGNYVNSDLYTVEEKTWQYNLKRFLPFRLSQNPLGTRKF